MSDLIQMEMTLEEARETDRLIKRHINTTRYLLLDMRDRKGWKSLGYESFVEYGEKELNFASTHLYQLANAAEISLQIGYSAMAEKQPAERQLRPLTEVPESERKAIWEEATRKAEEENAKLTAKRIEEAVTEWKQRQQESQTESNERRKKIRELESQINLLKAQSPKIPEDYETVKTEVRNLREQLSAVEARKEQLIQQQVVAKLAERQNEISVLERRAEQLQKTVAEYQDHIAKIHLPELEMKQQVEAVEKFVLSCSVLAAALAMFEYKPDSMTSSIWEKARTAAADAAEAIKLHIMIDR